MNKNINFYENGNIMEAGYEDNLGKQGTWLFYNEDGSLFKEEEYKNNVPHGKFVRYHENGKRAYETLLLNGLHDGKGISYYEDGSIDNEWYYKNGECFYLNFWNEKGEQLLTNGTGKMPFTYGSNDQKIIEKYFENGKVIKEVVIKDEKWSEWEFIPDSDR